jgi:DNA-binding PadR family transcriptional regulator
MAEPTQLKPQWFHILLAIADRPLHGTAIVEEVLDRTEGTVRLWPGMLYGSLREMADRGLIEEVDPPDDAPTEGGKRRFYAIRPPGRLALRAEVQRLAVFVRAARAKNVGDGLEGV